MQWADPSSLTLVGRLAREVAALPLVVVCAARLLPRRPELERMAEAIGARGGAHVYLGPLDEATCEAMAEELTGGEPGPELSARLGSCGGNPLFVSELLGTLAAEGVMHARSDGSVEVNAAGLPPSLALTVLGRLSFLTSGVVEVLTLASVLGSSFSVADLSLVAGRPTGHLWGPLREAMAAGVLEERGERLAFRHDVMREALYGDLPATVRVALHGDLGRALAAAGAPVGQAAEHVLRGARPGDRDAVAWLGGAGSGAGGGFNGGGAGGNQPFGKDCGGGCTSSVPTFGAGGGGASDVRTIARTSSATTLASRLIVAAGGGGGGEGFLGFGARGGAAGSPGDNGPGGSTGGGAGAAPGGAGGSSGGQPGTQGSGGDGSPSGGGGAAAATTAAAGAALRTFPASRAAAGAAEGRAMAARSALTSPAPRP